MKKSPPAVFHRYSPALVLIFAFALACLLLSAALRPATVGAQEGAQEEAASPVAVIFSENFDGLVAPAIPAGWTTAGTGENQPFRTLTTAPDTPPNAIFTNDPDTSGTSELISPPIALGSTAHKLSFRNFYQTDFEFDGGVLEISVAGAAFQDILAAGGSFETGGYDVALQGGTLAGRQAWTGQQAGYITTLINLPLNTSNQSIRLRWRFGTDGMEEQTGWRIDTIEITNQPVAPTVIGFEEKFDGVTAPQLPNGWTTASTGAGTPFVTSTASPDTPPNAAFTTDPSMVGSADLISPIVRVGGNSPKVIFRHFYDLEDTYDGGVLDIKINNGNFQDIIAAGGSFVTGPYTDTINSGFENPIGGRMAWSGNSNGYVTTEVNLPAAAFRQDVQFRWRAGSDNIIGDVGWRIDNVQITNTISGENQGAIAIPASGLAAPYPSEINLTNESGLLSNVQVNLTNFSHTAPDDVDLMLVAPNGRKVILMSDVGGINPVSNLNISFDDAAPAVLPDAGPLVSGVYKPTNFEPGDDFPAPAPTGAPTGSLLSSLNGGEANGAWKLFLVDDNGNNAGSISGGWSIIVQSSTNVIALPEVGAAQPYPSQVTVSGLQGSVVKAVVKIPNFSHTAPDDADLLLVAPNGRSVVLMSDVGGSTEVGGVNLTFDDAAATILPDAGPLTSGTYRPTNFEAGDAFPAPAPISAPTGTTLQTFYGGGPNGVWRLFVVDDTGANLGSIAGEWEVELETSLGACQFSITPSVQNFPITGGAGSFAITMPVGCSWTASTGASFINITSPTSGDASGTITFTVAPNFGGGRTGTIVVSNGFLTRTFQVQQGSGCPFALGQSILNFGAPGGSGSVAVTAGSACAYQATTNVNWITITSAPQTGDGTVTFIVQPNTGGAGRTGTITIGARSIVVNQTVATGRKFDFNGDGRADVSVYRPSSGVWYVLQSGSPNVLSAAQFGTETDRIAPADYDGDRKTDLAVYREGSWYILQSQTNTVRVEGLGLPTDTPVPADYDGDGRSDLAVYRPSTGVWYVRRSLDGASQTVSFGVATDKPMPADYDGDGKTDIAVYRSGAQSQWIILQSSDGAIVFRSFGTAADIAVPADYNGDGRDDVAVFRPAEGAWYITSPTNVTISQWGTSGDVPSPADYDGDGRADLTVFRQGSWYVLNSASGTLRTETFGLGNDVPVPSAYIR